MSEFEMLARQGYDRCDLAYLAGADCYCPKCGGGFDAFDPTIGGQG